MNEQILKFKVFRIHIDNIYEFEGMNYCNRENFPDNVLEYKKYLNDGWEIEKEEYIGNENYIDFIITIKKKAV